jgi:hypothetical protein
VDLRPHPRAMRPRRMQRRGGACARRRARALARGLTFGIPSCSSSMRCTLACAPPRLRPRRHGAETGGLQALGEGGEKERRGGGGEGAWSAGVICGKVKPNRCPVAGSTLTGLVEPKGAPDAARGTVIGMPPVRLARRHDGTWWSACECCRRPRRSRAEVGCADQTEAVRVDVLPRAHHPFPPAGMQASCAVLSSTDGPPAERVCCFRP